MKRINFLLLPFIYPILLSLYNLFTGGMESYVVIPFGVYINVHSLTILCESLLFISSFLILKNIHLTYRLVVSVGLCLTAEYFDDGMWSLFYHLTHGQLIGLFVQRMIVSAMFIIILWSMNKHFHRLYVSKWFVLGMVSFILSLALLELVGFYGLWFQFDKGFSTIDPHRMDVCGFPWAVSKVVAVFMWLLLIRRE